MRFTISLLALVCSGAFSLDASAQDSVSKINGLPGDAIDSRSATEQINDFVVDQAAFKSSWSKAYAIAPVMKLSATRNTSPIFFTTAAGSQAISQRTKSGVSFLRSSYSLWNQPGFGINDDPLRNDVPSTVSTTGLTGYQLSIGAAEFADGNPTGTNLRGISGGVVNFTDALPSRLYVSRVVAAVNGPTEGCSLASVALGAVDEDGNVAFRADGNSSGVPCSGLIPVGNGVATLDDNLFAVDMTQRTGIVNSVSDNFPALGGDTAAMERVLTNHPFSVSCPNIVPKSLAGRRIVVATNFNIQYLFEQTAGSVVAATASTHLAAGVTDTRGSVSYSTQNFASLFPGSVNGTVGLLGKSVTLTDQLNVFGVDAVGNFLAPRALALPATVTDPVQAWSNTNAAGTQQFDHYHGSIAFQGGSGQIALGRDQAGNLLAAAVVYYGGFSNTDSNNYIAVSKTDPVTGVTTWTPAAWTLVVGTSSTGKTIFQNGTTPIGNLSAFSATTTSGTTMSAPMIDSVGNVWFVGSFQLTAGGGVNVGVFRAVLEPATFSYKLELVLKQGDVFPGRNSGKNYMVDFIKLNAATTISSSTAYSSNLSGTSYKNVSTTGLSTDDPRTLGGLVISAGIVYDNNGDGLYVKSTGTGGTVGSPDEDYNVLLYVAASADCNNNGIPDDRDIFDGTSQDSNANGIPDSCEGILGLAFCFGDGSGTQCPCGNNSVVGNKQGCLSSLGVGAKLTAGGFASIANDTAVLSGVNMPNSSALYFQGTNQQSAGAGAVFGDGLRCAGGSIIRLKTLANSAGASSYPGVGDPKISVKGLISTPVTRTYQIWYRNSANFCTASTFNLSNGIQISWTP